MASSELLRRLESTIEKVQDFPIPGVLFRDISPIFQHPDLYTEVVEDLAHFSRGKVDVVCGIESRGYLFGIAIAVALNVPFVLIRKAGKLPPPVVGEHYALEYGTAKIEMRTGAISPGQRVLVHDDLLATGGTTEAAARLIEAQGARAVQFSFLIGLEALKGRERLEPFGAEVYEVVRY